MALMDRKVRHYKEEVADLAQTLPDVADAYHRFTEECFASGELDERTKHLIALGVSLYANNEVCTFYHVAEARAHGASNRQIMEASSVAAAAASGHAISQGVTRVQGALEIGDRLEPQPRQVAQNDLLADTEFAEDLWEPGMDLPMGATISPSY